MKRYLLFAGLDHDKWVGWDALEGQFDSAQAAYDHAMRDESIRQNCDRFQVVDTRQNPPTVETYWAATGSALETDT